MRVCGNCEYIYEFKNDKGRKLWICGETNIEKVTEGMYKILTVLPKTDAIHCMKYVEKGEKQVIERNL